jgi:alpha-beta hydrolase superfamily lysophospholipase
LSCLGYDVFAMDLRGHGESEGDNSLINDIDHLDMDFLLF